MVFKQGLPIPLEAFGEILYLTATSRTIADAAPTLD